ncbi:NLP4 protein [Emericellopsis atlantica]|uniref:NLP4 protein n=1 Tax=Emericellopsis atlantica TaxID=2614577 RepID=A0A9P7ZGS1_9HYPO|nr:NLP4 protein [Emericellopsis atlantica]KAG9251824.1 NLP4 protein [Emericellopsis atlantica]
MRGICCRHFTMMIDGLKLLLAVAALLLPVVFANPVLRIQNPLIAPVPTCYRTMQMNYQPAFDFDMDSCYNAPAVDPTGAVNPGRSTCDIKNPNNAVECRVPSYLHNNNVYVRSRTNSGWTAQMYGYYFEVDHKETCSGHRHDWEHVVVWLEGDVVRYVAASAHGDYEVRPVQDALEVNGHTKIVYHRDGSSTHAMRFAKEGDEPPENHGGSWFYGGLVDYYGFPNDDVRAAMLANDWLPGKIDFSDVRFADALELAKGGYDIPLDVGRDDEGTTYRPC